MFKRVLETGEANETIEGAVVVGEEEQELGAHRHARILCIMCSHPASCTGGQKLTVRFGDRHSYVVRALFVGRVFLRDTLYPPWSTKG